MANRATNTPTTPGDANDTTEEEPNRCGRVAILTPVNAEDCWSGSRQPHPGRQRTPITSNIHQGMKSSSATGRTGPPGPSKSPKPIALNVDHGSPVSGAHRPDKASTIRSRIPRNAGSTPTISPMITAGANPEHPDGPQRRGRNQAAILVPASPARRPPRLRKRRCPPRQQITDDNTASPNTRARTVWRLEKPIVFNIAISGMRSRTACAMVFPVSSTRVKNTAPKWLRQ